MGFIKWNNRYSVRVTEIDDQHKKLIGLINQMYDAMSAKKGHEVLGPILTELVSYTVYHFNTEEQMFQRYDYPEYEKHKAIHDDLARKAKQLKEEFDRGNTRITIDVMLFLNNWLNNHILEEDIRFGSHLNDKGVH